jgi:hypothetical protein
VDVDNPDRDAQFRLINEAVNAIPTKPATVPI